MLGSCFAALGQPSAGGEAWAEKAKALWISTVQTASKTLAEHKSMPIGTNSAYCADHLTPQAFVMFARGGGLTPLSFCNVR